MLIDLLRAAGRLGAEECAEVFAEAPGHNVDHTQQHDHSLAEKAQLQLRAADYEEEREQRGGPPVGLFHQILRQRADVAEHRPEHHAGQQRRKADCDRPDLEAQSRQRAGQEHDSNAHVQAVGVGVEELFEPCQHHAHQRAEAQRKHDLQHRIDQNRDHIHRAGVHGVRDTEGNGEHDQTDRIVERNDRQQKIDQLALRLILPHDHQRRRRSGRRSDGAEDDGLIDADKAREEDAENDQHDIDQQRCSHRLHNADHRRLTAGLAQRTQPELVTDGKRDKAQRNVRDDGELTDRVHRHEAEAVQSESAEAVRADQNAGHQIRRHGRKPQRLEHAGHEKSRENCNGK